MDWAPRVVDHAVKIIPDIEPEPIEEEDSELVLMKEIPLPERLVFSEIAENLRAKSSGSVGILGVSVSGKGALTVVASSPEGYIVTVAEPEKCALISDWPAETIKQCLTFSLLWID